jgi:hypothetical protein
MSMNVEFSADILILDALIKFSVDVIGRGE